MTQAMTTDKARAALTAERTIYSTFLNLHGAIWNFPEEDISNFDRIEITRAKMIGSFGNERHEFEVLGYINGAQAKELYNEGFLQHHFVCFIGHEPHFVLVDGQMDRIMDRLHDPKCWMKESRARHTINKETARFEKFLSL